MSGREGCAKNTNPSRDLRAQCQNREKIIQPKLKKTEDPLNPPTEEGTSLLPQDPITERKRITSANADWAERLKRGEGGQMHRAGE